MARRGRVVLAGAAFAAVVSALAFRAAREGGLDPRNEDLWVLCDFRDAIYFPARALLDGVNPYDGERFLAAYPVPRRFPIYSPSVLALHLPWGLVAYETGAVLFWIVTLALTLALAHAARRDATDEPVVGAAGTLALAACLLASRPGQQNLLVGQATLELVLAMFVAWRWGPTRPVLAGIALAVALGKVTFGLPLLVVMAALGWWRAVAVGVAVAAAVNGAVVAVLAARAGGVAALLEPLRVAAATTETIAEGHPALSYTRVDAIALVGRFLGDGPGTLGSLLITGGMLALAALACRRVAADAAWSEDARRRQLVVGVLTLTTLTCVYQQSYSVLLAAFPLVALPYRAPAGIGPGARALLLALLGLPFVNFAATAPGLVRLGAETGPAWLGLTSLNGLALAVAWAMYLGAALRLPARAAEDGAAPADRDTWRAHWDAHPAPTPSFAREAELFARRLREDFRLDCDTDVFDYGCGFGFVAAALAPDVRTVAVWEPARAMAAHARATLAGHPNVREVDLAAAGTRGDRPEVDLVVVNSVVQYMSEAEVARMLATLAGMLRPGGRIVVSDVVPPRHSLGREAVTFALRHPGLVRDRLWRWGRDYLRKMDALPLLRLGVEDLRRLAASAGLILETHRRNLTHFAGRTTFVLRPATLRAAILTFESPQGNLITQRLLRTRATEICGIVQALAVEPARPGWRSFLRIARRADTRLLAWKTAERVVSRLAWTWHRVRRRRPAIPTLAALAAEHGVPLVGTRDVNGAPAVATLRGWAPDVAVSVHFTQRLGKDVLAIPGLGTVNVHGALLPRNRGLFPYFWELANGDAEAGVTVHWVDEKLDTGDLILQRPIAIADDETVSSLAWKGAETGAALLEEALKLIASGAAPRLRQSSAASYYSWPRRADVTRLRRAGRRLGKLRDAWRRIGSG